MELIPSLKLVEFMVKFKNSFILVPMKFMVKHHRVVIKKFAFLILLTHMLQQ